MKVIDRANQAKSLKNRWATDIDYRERMSNSHKGNIGYWKDKEIPDYAKKKMSDSKKKYYKNNKPWNYGNYKIINCDICNKKIRRINAAISKNNFCSRKCQGIWLSNKPKNKHPNWRGGISFEKYGLDFNKELKNKIRKRDNFTCQECNFTEKMLNYILPVHHIDYNKKNNNENNLISLCRSCHTKTNFNRNNWSKYYQQKIYARS